MGGAEPTGEPHSQDTARGGRSIGLSMTIVQAVVVVAVPLVWAIFYLSQAGAAGVGSGFILLVGLVVLACLGVGWLLLRGLLRT